MYYIVKLCLESLFYQDNDNYITSFYIHCQYSPHHSCIATILLLLNNITSHHVKCASTLPYMGNYNNYKAIKHVRIEAHNVSTQNWICITPGGSHKFHSSSCDFWLPDLCSNIIALPSYCADVYLGECTFHVQYILPIHGTCFLMLPYDLIECSWCTQDNWDSVTLCDIIGWRRRLSLYTIYFCFTFMGIVWVKHVDSIAFRHIWVYVMKFCII